jgi:hypothetical protein
MSTADTQTVRRPVPYPIYIGRRIEWDVLLPSGRLWGIRFKNYSRCAGLL